MNSGNFITKWELSLVSQTRTVAVIRSAVPGGSLQAVWAPTREEIIAGTGQPFGEALACSTSGVFATGWASIPSGARGDVFVGLTLVVTEEVDELSFGIAEVQVR